MTREEYCKIIDNSNFYIDSQNPYDMKIKEALEKQIPQKPARSNEPRYGMGNEYYDWVCPNCGEWLAWQCDLERFNIHHCLCGQAIDWESE